MSRVLFSLTSTELSDEQRLLGRQLVNSLPATTLRDIYTQVQRNGQSFLEVAYNLGLMPDQTEAEPQIAQACA